MSTLSKFYERYIKDDLALYLVLIGELCASIMIVVAKLLESKDEFEEPMHPLQILLVRMVFTLAGTTTYQYVYKVPDTPFGPKGLRKWLILRGITGFVGVMGLYYPAIYLSVSDVITLTFLSPTITVILAVIFLKEKLSRIEVIGALVSLVGVLLIARPAFIFGDSAGYVDKKVETSDPKLRFIALTTCLVGVLGNSSTYVTIRFLGKRVDPILTISYFAFFTTVFSTIGIMASGLKFVIPNSTKQWVLLFIIGINGFLMQLFFTTGLQREKASKTSMMMYTQIVFSLFWEYIIWRHIPNFLSLSGTIVILGSAFVTFWYKPKHKDKAPELPNDEELQVSHSLLTDADIELKEYEFRTHQRELSIDSNSHI